MLLAGPAICTSFQNIWLISSDLVWKRLPEGRDCTPALRVQSAALRGRPQKGPAARATPALGYFAVGLTLSAGAAFSFLAAGIAESVTFQDSK